MDASGLTRHARVAALLLAGLAEPASAQELTAACSRPRTAMLVNAEQVEQAAEAHHARLLDSARSQNSLAPPSHPQMVRLQYTLDRILPFTAGCNERAAQWRWQISLIGARRPEFHGMPGGKLIVHLGVLSEPQLDDDEVAALVAHAMAESLLEHHRVRVATQLMLRGKAVEMAARSLGSAASGPEFSAGLQLLELRRARQQRLEADRLGMLLAASAGYRPQASVSLWQKLRQHQPSMPAVFDRSPPLQVQVDALERQLPEVLPVYARAAKPERRFAPPARLAATTPMPAASAASN